MTEAGRVFGAAIPVRATYRLQLHQGFTLADALAQVDYLAALGISHLYLSPIMAARPGSRHGYDIIDHNRINPELGTEADLVALVQALRGHGMGVILDIVPNHMAVGSDNLWWMDVLEWGQDSPYAGYFDIDWASSRQNLAGKVLLPVLGDQFGAVLDAGQIRLQLDSATGAISARYFEHRFPISPRHYAGLLRPVLSERMLAGFADMAGDPGRLARATAQRLKQELAQSVTRDAALAQAIDQALDLGAGALGQLLDQQAYRPDFWRVASDEINYRRFFNVNDLGGVRVELPELFEATHRMVFRLMGAGLIDGLRIDHIDGLYDPLGYLQNLVRTQGASPYIIVEKILAGYEDLPASWPVAGTTGYDALNLIGALFVDPAGERPLSTLYRRFTGRRQKFDDILYDSKQRILHVNLSSEVSVLAQELHRLSASDWHSRDYTLNAMRDALIEVLACFPVYRAYVDVKGTASSDRRYIDWAMGLARRRSPAADLSIFDFLAGVLTGDPALLPPRFAASAVRALAMRFQQLSGPVMAKGMEDTSFYRYFRLIALNEVGGDPRRFGLTLAGFHHVNEVRQKRHPRDMLAGSTHDTKRGEDARARLFCLSGLGREWGRQVRRWERMNRRLVAEIDDQPAPDAHTQYYLYQTLLGVWPPDLAIDDRAGLAALADRVDAAIIKGLREGKERSSWANPNEPYERAVSQFIRASLDPLRSPQFLTDFQAFCQPLAFYGALTSLSQTLIRLTMPGMPDIYQGAELWDLSLVDPDNRRPVDYAAARRLFRAAGDIEQARDLLARWRDGGVKHYVIGCILNLRRAQPSVFDPGSYWPVAVQGQLADHLVAFARGAAVPGLVTLAPRFWPALWPDLSAVPDWGDMAVHLPAGRWRSVFTGQIFEVAPDQPLAVAALLADFPLALLMLG